MLKMLSFDIREHWCLKILRPTRRTRYNTVIFFEQFLERDPITMEFALSEKQDMESLKPIGQRPSGDEKSYLTFSDGLTKSL